MYIQDNWTVIDNNIYINKDNYIIIDKYKENIPLNKLILNKFKITNGEIIIYNFENYMNNIYISYNKDYDYIKQQAKIDCDRADIFINNNKTNDFNNLINILEKNTDNKKDYNTMLMFCTQAAIAEPFIYLTKKFKIYDNNNLHIGENKNNKRNKIKLIIKNNYIKIIKTIRLFELDNLYNDKTIHEIRLIIILNIRKYIIKLKWQFI
jgi:hypothetical protein